MKFYLAIDPETGRKVLAPTQDKARVISKEFELFEISTDKDPLMQFAQEALDRIHDLEGQVNLLKHDAQIAPVTIEQAPVVQTPTPAITGINLQSIMEWLLNTASQAQVEEVFSAIGARWGEARS